MAESDRVVVGKLRFRSGAAFTGSPEGRALAEQVRRSLAEAELAPPEMPPAAVLVVRRVESSFAGRVARDAQKAWESDVRNRIGRSLARASRVSGGEIAEEAEAVLFRDPAEMTAALLLDVARGEARDRWWWRCAVGDARALRDLPSAFERDLRLVPAAVSYLSAWGRAEEVALALSPGDARDIAARLCSEFGLEELAASLRRAPGWAGAGGAPGGGPVAGPGGALDAWNAASGRRGSPEPVGSERGLRGYAGRGEGPGETGPGAGRGAAGEGAHSLSAGRGGSGDGARGNAGDRGPVNPAGPGTGPARSGAAGGKVSVGLPRLSPERGAAESTAAGGGTGSAGGGADRSGAGAAGRGAAGTGPFAGGRGAQPPWSLPARDFAERAGAERAALFGIAGLIARSPHAVRSREFASRFSAWWRERIEGTGGPLVESSDVRGSGAAGASDGERGGASDARGGRTGHGAAGGGARTRERGRAADAGTRGDGGRAFEGRAPGRSASSPSPETDRGAGRGEAGAGTGLSGSQAAGAGLRQFLGAGEAPEDPWSGADEYPTGLGGVLYLINAMRKLGIPQCFEEDWRLSSELGSWGSLQALAAGLIARSAGRKLPLPLEEVRADPIWRLLAELEGRDPGAPLGAGVIDPGAFALPERWQQFLGRERVELGRHLRPGASEEELEFPFLVAPALRRWIAGAASYVAVYIKDAAGPLAGPDFEPAALLFVDGRVYATRTHVDLVASLEQISLAARIAGLDANPGWDPHFARVVQFHFR